MFNSNHPVYNDDDSKGWIEFDTPKLESIDNYVGQFDLEVIEILKQDIDRIMQQAIFVLTHFLDKTHPAFQLDPELQYLMINNLNNQRKGFQVYFSFTFTAHWTEGRSDTDSWWVIIRSSEPFFWKERGREIPYTSEAFGWYCE